MSNSKIVFWLAFVVTLTLWHETTYALKSDKEQAIEVTANSAERDEKLGISTYRGNVVIRQGTLLIQAEQVEIKTVLSKKSSAEELDEITTTGQPSHFQQQVNAEGDLVDATAKIIHYRINDKKVDLIDSATLKQAGRVITGDKISYDVSAQRVSANSQESTTHETSSPAATTQKPGRVTVIIPANKNNDKNANGSKH